MCASFRWSWHKWRKRHTNQDTNTICVFPQSKQRGRKRHHQLKCAAFFHGRCDKMEIAYQRDVCHLLQWSRQKWRKGTPTRCAFFGCRRRNVGKAPTRCDVCLLPMVEAQMTKNDVRFSAVDGLKTHTNRCVPSSLMVEAEMKTEISVTYIYHFFWGRVAVSPSSTNSVRGNKLFAISTITIV